MRASFEALDRAAAANRGAPLRDKIRAQVDVWRHNRQLYPRWVVAPWSNRSDTFEYTAEWVAPIIAEVAVVAAHEKISWLRELVFRLDVCLLPLDEGVAGAVEVALAAAGFTTAENAAYPSRSLAEQVDLEDCVALTASLLRSHREVGDAEAFARLETPLLAMATVTPDIRSLAAYERILLHLGRLEYARAEICLASWVQMSGDPMWAVRRAALTIEMGMPDGLRLVGEALTKVQDALPRGPVHEASDFHLLSSEGWALVNVLNLRDAGSAGVGGRLEDLAAIQCDPFATLERMKSVLSIRGTSRRGTLQRQPSELQFALQANRLIEVGGRIVRRGNEIVGAVLLRHAASRIAESRLRLALPLLLRIGDAKYIAETLNIAAIATLSVNEIASLSSIFRAALAEAMPRVSRPQEQAALSTPADVRNQRVQDQAEAALAGLQSLSPRLPPDLLDEMVSDLSRQRRAWGGGVWQVRLKLDETSNSLLNAMGDHRRSAHALDLIDQPLAGTIKNTPGVIGWSNDPIGLLSDTVGDRSLDSDRWCGVIEKLFHELATTQIPAAQADGLYRCVVLNRMGLLTPEERQRLAALIWSPNGLAAKLYLPPAYLLALPEQVAGQARAAVTAHFRAQSLPRFALDGYGERRWKMDPAADQDLLVNMLRLTPTPFDAARPPRLGAIEWSADDIAATLRKIEAWWRDEGREFYTHLQEPSPWPTPRWRMSSIIQAIFYLALPHQSLALQAAQLLRQLHDAGVEITLARPLLALEDPSKAAEAAAALRQAIVSDDPATATAAMGSAFVWLKNASGTLPPMPLDLPRAIGSAVCHRQKSGLHWALHVATLLLASAPDPLFLEDIRIGLHHLRLETSGESAPFNETDGGALLSARGPAIRLLAAYARCVEGSDQVVEAWLAAADDEPIEGDRAALLNVRAEREARRSPPPAEQN